MSLLGNIIGGIRALFRKKQAEQDMNEELRGYLDAAAEEKMRSGMSHEQALRAARVEMGSMEAVKENIRAVGWEAKLESIGQDFRYAFRMFRKHPGFSAVAVLTLVLGIGANTAIFSVMNVMLLKALPVREPQQLVEFVRWDPRGALMSNLPHAVFEYLSKDTKVLSGIFAFFSNSRVLRSSTGAELISVHEVSGSFFPTLGVKPLLGRAIDESEGRADADHQVVVLSYPFWSSHFGRDPAVLGKSLRISGAACTVIGVMPAGFFGVDRSQAPDLWVPFPAGPIQSEAWVLGRLKPGVSIPQARDALQPLFHDALESMREEWKDSPERDRAAFLGERLVVNRATRGTSGLRWYYWEYSNTLKILIGMTVLVLLIACLNLANLLMARSAARVQEIGIRLAVGAGRGRIVRQLLTETLLLALLGGAGGLLLAVWGHRLLVSFLTGGPESASLDFRLDGRVLWFSLAVSMLAGMLSGMLPALRATHARVGPAIQSRGAARLPFVRKLLVAQVALSLTLLVGAGLFVRSLRNLAGADLGLARQDLFIMLVDPTPSRALKDKREFWAQLTRRVEALPGVRSASVAGDAVFGNGGWNAATWYRRSDGTVGEMQVAYNAVGPRFFETVGIPLLAGREFGTMDQPHSQPVAVVNRTFAQRFFDGRTPIGEHFGNAGPGSSGQIEIVGVIADAKYGGLRDRPTPMFYLPLAQQFEDRAYHVHVRTAGDTPAVVAAVRRAIQDMDQDIFVYPAHTIPEVIQNLLQHDRMFAVLAAAFGSLALLLTSIGIYGVVAYQVARRTNEIGVRMAIGARDRDIVWMVLRETLLLLLVGTAIGLPAAAAAARWLREMFYALAPTDPAAILGAIITLVVVGVLAGFLPARRAAKVDPIVALRHE